MNVTAPFSVTESSQIAEPRRAVQWLAGALDFSTERAGRAALIVSELATNLVKHARGGEVLLRSLSDDGGSPGGIEILALDKGPGMTDLAASRRDGHSTSGTLGYGLGSIERLADSIDLYTHATGTAIAARLWRQPPARGAAPRCDVGAVHVSKPGESVCGDGWSWRMRDGRLAILVADGLGHGLHAHEASLAAIDVFARSHESPPASVLADANGALRPTRGAAVAVLALDLDRRRATFAGLGNISGAILLPSGRRHNMVSHNGTAGHSAARIQEFQYDVPADSTIVLFSDGLATHWSLDTYPGLRARSSTLTAGVLYRDFSRRRDDVTVVVVKECTGADTGEEPRWDPRPPRP